MSGRSDDVRRAGEADAADRDRAQSVSCAPLHPTKTFGSENVEIEVVAFVEFLLVPVVPAVGVPEAEHSVATVEIAVVRALDLGDNTLVARG